MGCQAFGDFDSPGRDADEGDGAEIGVALNNFVSDAPQDAINGGGVEDGDGTGDRWRRQVVFWHLVFLGDLTGSHLKEQMVNAVAGNPGGGFRARPNGV
jgi:hypothetical protein